MLKHALEYVARGWDIFPCHNIQDGRCTCGTDCGRNAGKHPRISNGHNGATTDAATIKKWWAKWPCANIGFAVPENIAVIDVDIKHHEGKFGDDSLDDWEREHGKLPDTVLSLTGGGGKQYFFTADRAVSCTTGLLPSIDVKSKGGYVILPPSSHISGRNYDWEASSDPAAVEMQPLPEAFYALMKTTKAAGAELTEKIGEGMRNDTLFKLSCSLRGKGLSGPEILAAVAAVNQERCAPPLNDGEVHTIVQSAAKYERGGLPGDDVGEKEQKKAQAEILLEIVSGTGADFFHSDTNELYATLPIAGHTEIWGLESRDFSTWLQGLYYKSVGRPAGNDAVNQAVSVLSARARFDKPEPVKLSTRTAESDGAVWYDLSNPKWQAVKITRDGWSIVNNPPILFNRYRHQSPQVMPQPGGNISKVLSHINLTGNDILFLCWLVSCFIPDIPHPMATIYGEKGSAKSTACSLLKSLIDPSALETLTLQNDPRALAVNFMQNWFLPFDNVSFINDETSDTLCRAITGGGIQQRRLFTNAEDTIFTFKRCLAINGINNTATRPDLLDRSILVELERISESDRRELAEIQAAFETDRPAILGGIFDTLVKAMNIFPNAKLDGLPRMADFCRWGYSIGEALGGEGETFLKQYAENRASQNAEAIAADPVAVLIVEYMSNRKTWSGKVSELLKDLIYNAPTYGINPRAKGFPTQPNLLSRRLRGIKSNLEAVGITFEKGEDNRGTNITLNRAN